MAVEALVGLAQHGKCAATRPFRVGKMVSGSRAQKSSNVPHLGEYNRAQRAYRQAQLFNVAAPFIAGMDSPQVGILILGNRVLAELHGIGSVRLGRVNSSIVKKRVPKTSRSGTRGSSRRLPAQTALDDHVRARVKAFLADSLLSEEQFGQTVLGDPKFVPGLDKGRSMRLDAADRVLRFMGEFAIGPRFRREIEAFTTVTGTKRSTLGEKATGERSFVSRLKRGKPPRLRAVQRVRTWMHEHASEEERAAIARAVADDGMAGPALSLDPAAPVAPAEAPDPGNSPHETPSRRERKPFLSTREAAALLNLSPRTLDRMRTSGSGPAYHKFTNKIAYARADLLAWAWARRHEENLEAD